MKEIQVIIFKVDFETQIPCPKLEVDARNRNANDKLIKSYVLHSISYNFTIC